MSEEIKLELTPSAQTNDITPTPKESAPVENQLTLASLPENEKKIVKEFMEKIDITDSSVVVQYGASAQNKIAQFSDSVLKNVKAKDTGESGKLLSDLVVEIKNFDVSTEEKSGFLGLFGGVKNQIEKMVSRYSKVEVNIDKIVEVLENHRRQLLKDIAMFDVMFENNHNYFKELNLYIIAGKEKLEEINDITIPKLRAKAEASGDEADAQSLNDLLNSANRFDKKIHDLQLSRMISIQMAPQIRLIQNNDAQLVDKIQSSIVNSIPLWKNQIVIALGLANSKNAMMSQRKVTDMTNELLRKNSELLKQGTVEIATESERSIVSIDTIKKTNQNLIETINSVLEIQQRGKEQRAAAEVELAKIEDELKATLITKR